MNSTSVECKQQASQEYEKERENDVDAEYLDVWQCDDQRELEHVHQHVERVLHSADNSSLYLGHRLLHRLGHHQVRHPQT